MVGLIIFLLVFCEFRIEILGFTISYTCLMSYILLQGNVSHVLFVGTTAKYTLMLLKHLQKLKNTNEQ